MKFVDIILTLYLFETRKEDLFILHWIFIFLRGISPKVKLSIAYLYLLSVRNVKSRMSQWILSPHASWQLQFYHSQSNWTLKSVPNSWAQISVGPIHNYFLAKLWIIPSKIEKEKRIENQNQNYICYSNQNEWSHENVFMIHS